MIALRFHLAGGDHPHADPASVRYFSCMVPARERRAVQAYLTAHHLNFVCVDLLRMGWIHGETVLFLGEGTTPRREWASLTIEQSLALLQKTLDEMSMTARGKFWTNSREWGLIGENESEHKKIEWWGTPKVSQSEMEFWIREHGIKSKLVQSRHGVWRADLEYLAMSDRQLDEFREFLCIEDLSWLDDVEIEIVTAGTWEWENGWMRFFPSTC